MAKKMVVGVVVPAILSSALLSSAPKLKPWNSTLAISHRTGDVEALSLDHGFSAQSGEIRAGEALSLLGTTAVAQVTAGIATNQYQLKDGIDPMSLMNSKRGGVLDFGDRRLVNNVWGAPPDEEFSSGIYQEPEGSFGWYWDRPEPKKKLGEAQVHPIYPCVRIGGSPSEPSRSSFSPTRVKDLNSLLFDVSYSYPETPTGATNLAYDVFFMESNQPSASPAIRAEVMIWVLGTATQPADKYNGDFSDGHNTYALYSWVMANGRQYYAFLMKRPSGYEGHHTVDAKKLLDAIPLKPEWCLHGIDFGSEVWQGQGRIQIDQLSVNLNGAEF